MTIYQVIITQSAQKQLLKLTFVIRERIAEHIGMLGNNPEAKLRLRVGNYRVKFNRDNGIRIVEIVRVGHRKEIYK